MRVLGFFLGFAACVAASADAATDTYEPHHQAFSCSVGGCSVSCPTTGRSPAIQFKAGALMGSGQNISVQGVFFTTSDSLPVTVRINGKSEPLPAELVRYETLGDGQVGIAVRFLKPNPSLTS